MVPRFPWSLPVYQNLPPAYLTNHPLRISLDMHVTYYEYIISGLHGFNMSCSFE
jgi:hypothetical protein